MPMLGKYRPKLYLYTIVSVQRYAKKMGNSIVS